MLNKNLCKFPMSNLLEHFKINCFVFEQNMNVMYEMDRLNAYRMILVTQGEGIFFFENQTVPFKKGDLIFGFVDEQFYLIKGKNVNYMYIDFSGSRVFELLKRFEVNKVRRHFSGFDSSIPFWNENLIRADENTIDLISESVILNSFSKINVNTSLKDSLINEVINIANNEFKNSELTISLIADEIGYNVKYLSHLFKTKVGMAFTKYLTSLRINYAVSLLDYGINSVKNVALLSGFNEPFYFSNVFKKIIGVSPKEYMKK